MTAATPARYQRRADALAMRARAHKRSQMHHRREGRRAAEQLAALIESAARLGITIEIRPPKRSTP